MLTWLHIILQEPLYFSALPHSKLKSFVSRCYFNFSHSHFTNFTFVSFFPTTGKLLLSWLPVTIIMFNIMDTSALILLNFSVIFTYRSSLIALRNIFLSRIIYSYLIQFSLDPLSVYHFHAHQPATGSHPQSMVDCMWNSPIQSNPEMRGNYELTLGSSINYWLARWQINTPAPFILKKDNSEACFIHWLPEFSMGLCSSQPVVTNCITHLLLAFSFF